MRDIEQDEADVERRNLRDEHLPIALFQCRAAQDAARSPFIPAQQQLVQAGQPGLAILVGQRDVGMHLCPVGFGMEVVGVSKPPACFRSQQFAHRSLAGTGYPHEHENHSFLLTSVGPPAQ